MQHSLSLSTQNGVTLKKKKVAEIRNILKTYSSRPIDYVFCEKLEKKKLECLLEKLPFYELKKESFFVIVQPYYFISQKLQECFKQKGFVYFIQNESGLIKIGRSKNPINRLANIKLCCNNPKLLHKVLVTNNILAEIKLHEFFKSKKVYGEWFNISVQDIEAAKRFLISEGLDYRKRGDK